MRNKISRAVRYILHGVQPKYITANVTVSSNGSKLNAKKVIITGGGRGLGYYIAKKCIAEGADVIIVGRNEETLKKSAEDLNCKYLCFDVSEIAGIHDFFNKCEKLFGDTADCLVNNAGISLHENDIYHVTEETWDKQFNVNLKAPYFLSKEFVDRIERAHKTSASIIFMTSERGLYCDDIPYGLIKAAINSLTQGLGRRLLSRNIRVNAIAPGVTASDMTGYSKDGNLNRAAACSGRVYLPEEIAEVAAFLLSDESGCISSHIVPCNNGNHLRCDW